MRLLLLVSVLSLTACDSSSTSSTSSAPATAAQPSAAVASPVAAASAPSTNAPSADGISGRVLNAPRGTWVHLVEPVTTARTLLEQANTILDSTEADAAGAFRFRHPARGVPGELLVSAPGRALARVSLSDAASITLQPEAVCEVRLPASEEDAMALVLSADGRALAVPLTELVADATGALQATRLPAGTYQLVVGSADGQRFASATVRVATGERVELRLTLEANDDDQLRFLRALGHPEAGSFFEEVGR